MANTPFLNLVKPTDTDQALITDINNNSDKIDTGVSALSEQIAAHSFGDKTVSDLETALDTFCASMTDGEYKHVWVHITAASGVFVATNYTGFVECNLSTVRWSVLLSEQASGRTIRGCKTSSGWVWQQLALKSDIDVQAVTFTPDTSVVDQNNLFIRKSGNVVTVNGYVTLQAAVSTGTTVIGTIASGSIPIASVRVPCAISSQAYNVPSSMGYLVIGENGKIAVKAASGNTNKTIYFTASYVAQA